GVLPCLLRQYLEASLEQIQGLIRETAQTLIKRAAIGRGERFGGECWIFVIRGECQMEFAGSFTEQASGRAVSADDLLSQCRDFLFRKLNQGLFGKCGISQVRVTAQDIFKVPA